MRNTLPAIYSVPEPTTCVIIATVLRNWVGVVPPGGIITTPSAPVKFRLVQDTALQGPGVTAARVAAARRPCAGEHRSQPFSITSRGFAQP